MSRVVLDEDDEFPIVEKALDKITEMRKEA